MQIHGMDTSYLLQNKYTIFISPVLYRDTTRREFPFREIEGPGSPRQNQRLFVNVLDSLVSPFNDKEALIESKFHKRVKLFFDTDPDAFDLGHTNP
jgi:hypothetical protein